MSEISQVLLGRMSKQAEQIALDLEEFGGDKVFITVFRNGYFNVSVSDGDSEITATRYTTHGGLKINPYQE